MQTNNSSPSPTLAPVEAQAPTIYWITLYHYQHTLFILCTHHHTSFNEAKECLISTNRCSPDSFIAQVRSEIKVVEDEIITFDITGRKVQSTYFHWTRYDQQFDVLGHHYLADDLSLEQCQDKIDKQRQAEQERRKQLKQERLLEKQKTLAKAQAPGATPPSTQIAPKPAQTEVVLGQMFNDIANSHSCAFEEVTQDKCKKCNEKIIFTCDSIGKLEGKTILLGSDRCPNCGVKPLTKKQQQLYQRISEKVTNLRKLRSSNITKLPNGELAVMG